MLIINPEIMKKLKLVESIWPAPSPSPIAIAKKIYINSSGSFTGVRNLTIDRAPTKPRDKARDVFIIVITRTITAIKTGKIKKYSPFEWSKFENLETSKFNITPKKTARRRAIKSS